MNTSDITKARNPDLRGSLEALRRAAVMARQTAIQTNTAIIIVQNGQRICVTAEELLKQQAAGKS